MTVSVVVSSPGECHCRPQLSGGAVYAMAYLRTKACTPATADSWVSQRGRCPLQETGPAIPGGDAPLGGTLGVRCRGPSRIGCAALCHHPPQHWPVHRPSTAPRPDVEMSDWLGGVVYLGRAASIWQPWGHDRSPQTPGRHSPWGPVDGLCHVTGAATPPAHVGDPADRVAVGRLRVPRVPSLLAPRIFACVETRGRRACGHRLSGDRRCQHDGSHENESLPPSLPYQLPLPPLSASFTRFTASYFLETMTIPGGTR